MLIRSVSRLPPGHFVMFTGGGYDDGEENCYAGYRGYVRQRNAHEMSYNHVVKDEYGVDRTQSSKIKVRVEKGGRGGPVFLPCGRGTTECAVCSLTLNECWPFSLLLSDVLAQACRLILTPVVESWRLCPDSHLLLSRLHLQIFVGPRSIRITDYENEIIDDIAYTDITKIDHKHDRGQSDGHRNFLAFNLKVSHLCANLFFLRSMKPRWRCVAPSIPLRSTAPAPAAVESGRIRFDTARRFSSLFRTAPCL